MIDPIQLCSNALSTSILEGLREVIGQQDYDAALQAVGVSPLDGIKTGVISNTDLLKLRNICVDLYGDLSTRGIAFRSGQSAFHYFLKEFADQAGFEELDFRLLPLKKRIFTGMQSIAAIVQQDCGLEAKITQEEKKWIVEIASCGSEGRKVDQDVTCGLILGFLKEYLGWISGGKSYFFQETACREIGKTACVFDIAQNPID